MADETYPSVTTLTLEPGTLWEKVKECTDRAIACGALQSIPTECESIEASGIPFIIRIASNLERKEQAKKQQEKNGNFLQKRNPFLPYDEDLFVANISETHLCLLNKFNVVNYHLLIVTRQFEEQEELLNLQDFEAMWACLREIEGLAFYNGGKIAGASQPHKHLQLMPVPIASSGLPIPIAPAIASAEFEAGIGTVPQFPFVCAIAKFPPNLADRCPKKAAELTLAEYRKLLNAVGLEPAVNDTKQPGPYNLLAMRDWMLIVPRSQETYQSICINSLGFAGSLFVRNLEQKQLIQELGPIAILQQVARSICS